MTVIYTPHRPDRLVSADYAAEKRKSSPKAFNGMGIGAQTAFHINVGLPNLFARLNAEVQG